VCTVQKRVIRHRVWNSRNTKTEDDEVELGMGLIAEQMRKEREEKNGREVLLFTFGEAGYAQEIEKNRK